MSHVSSLEPRVHPGVRDGRTKVVAMSHVSNLLGEVADVAAVSRLLRRGLGTGGTRPHLAVDGVAYAPHLLQDCAAWAVDW